VQDLSLGFGGIQALVDIRLEVRSGELLSVIGLALACAALRSSWAWIALSIRATSATLPFGTWLKTLR
jgi:ABC-type uncharacterized transport system ATPase subunit